MSMMTDDEGLSRWNFSDDLYSSVTTKGLYNPLQFVVRLQREYYDQLHSPRRILYSGNANPSLLQAFSTYFHETVHWWQHIGSTTGLMLSFAYPAQTHANLSYLRQILNSIGPRKSLLAIVNNNYKGIPEDIHKLLNIVVNNWHDIEFNKRIILDPLRIKAVVRSPMFECVGHSLVIGLAHTIGSLASTFDPLIEFMPDFRKWPEAFAELRHQKATGFYHGSDVKLVPLGAIRVFEGQARFNQLQFLYLASGGHFDWAAAEERGMMSPVYTDAFRYFLEAAELQWPSTPVDPIVQIFLLICDLSINPSDGFPFDLYHHLSLIESVDPSFRFLVFCRQVAKNPALAKAITRCTQDEFVSVASELCERLVCKHPAEIAARVMKWTGKSSLLQTLLKQDETFEFGVENIPIKVLFAKFIRFCEDRLKRPEFFCWPAMHMVSHGMSNINLNESMELWDRHHPLFIADLEGEIRPMLLEGRHEKNVYQTFNDFYAGNVLYDVVRQWTVSDGPFNYDYRWLTPKYTTEVTKPFVNREFERAFGISLDSFVLN